jgi:hypothetical protein
MAANFLTAAWKKAARALGLSRKRRATRRRAMRGGMRPASTLRSNAEEFVPYSEAYPALPDTKKTAPPRKKGNIWPASSNYKKGRGSAALKNATRGGRRRSVKRGTRRH